MTQKLKNRKASKNELKEAIAQREKNEAQIIKLSRAVEQSPISIVITSTNGDIEYVNPFFCQLTGYTSAEALGKNPRILKSGYQPWEYYKNLWDTITAGGLWKGEFHNKKKSGEIYWESAVIAPVKNTQGAITHFIAVKEDITERKRIEKELEEAMNVKMEFMSMVSHELRTPLTVIKESVAIVHDGVAGVITKDQKDFLDTAKRNVDRLSRLINNVLDYQKLESGDEALRLADHDMSEVLREVAKGFDLVCRSKGLRIALDLQEGIPWFRFDRDKITQVVTNFLSNAIKFTEKGTITLLSSLEGNMVQVSVKDEGPGIREEDRPKLFKSFSQIPDTDGRKVGGTGLGLAISKKIIDHHHGKIGVGSVYGQGATFYFILPIKERREII